MKYDDYSVVLEAKLPIPTTWGVLRDMAMDLVDRSEDKHHIFIEEISEDPDGQTVWVGTGS